MGQVIQLVNPPRGSDREERTIVLELSEVSYLRLFELGARLAYIHHTAAQAMEDVTEQLTTLVRAMSDPDERERLSPRLSETLRAVEADHRGRIEASHRARRAKEEDARERNEAWRRAQDIWRAMGREAREGLLLDALGPDRLTGAEIAERMNLRLGQQPDEYRPLCADSARYVADGMVRTGRLERLAESFKGNFRYRYFRGVEAVA